MRKLSFSRLFILAVSGCFFILSCQKGISWDNESLPISDTTTLVNANDSSAAFALMKGSGSMCATVNVTGTYTAGTPVSDSNQARVDINVTKTGTYNVVTGTSNGISFSATGSFATTGMQTLTLKAAGTPAASGTTTIPITAGSSTCNFTVVVQ